MSGTGTASDSAATGRTQRRSLSLPVAAVVGVAAISTIGVAWATSLPPLPTTSTSRFLPADGTVSREDLVNDAGQAVLVSEHARQRGAQALVSLPSTYAVAVINAAESLDIPVEQISVWRVSTRLVRDDVAANPTTAIYLDSPAGIHQVGAYGGSFPTVYDPPLLAMPADPEVGTTWSGDGDGLPGSILTYDSNGEVTAVDGDCVTIDVTLSLDLDGALLSQADSIEQWCAGGGVVSATATYTFKSSSEDIILRLDDSLDLPSVVGDPVGVPRSPTAGDVTDVWALRDVPTQYVDDFFGPQDVGGTIGADPVALPDDRLLLPYSSGDDVVSYTLQDTEGGDGLVEQWRAHPGDGVLTVAGIGDLIVTTTTGRRVVAHDASGVQRWAGATDDLVLAPAVGTPSGTAVTVGLDGAVTAWDARTGEIAWTADLVTDADLPAVVAEHPETGHAVIATDRNGTILALDPADGTVLWETADAPLDVLAPGVPGTVVTVSDDGRVSVLDAATGDRRWLARIGGFASSAHIVDDLTVVAGDREVVAFDQEGNRIWSSASVDQAVTVGATIVVLRSDVLTALDADGEVVSTWDLASTEVGTTHRLTVGAPGVWVVASTSSIRLLGEVTR